MTNLAPKPAQTSCADDPRRKFEKAMAQIQQSGRALAPSQRPIVARKTAVATDHDSQKQALVEAARALARIWGVSPALIR
jgi:hypothetical protein